MKIVLDKHSCTVKDIYGKELIKIEYDNAFDSFIRDILNPSQFVIYCERDSTHTISKKAEKKLKEYIKNNNKKST